MDTPLIPIKTPDGQAELGNRQRRVSQRHRTVLLLVDGRRTEDEVRALAAQAGAGESCFAELVELGLISLPAPPAAVAQSLAAEPTSGPAIPEEPRESLLPVARAVPPEPALDGPAAAADAASPDTVFQEFDFIGAGADSSLEEARNLLVKALRAEAPLAGSLTRMRLRRARTRADVVQLMDEVEAHMRKPHRSVTVQQTLQRARHLLFTPQIDMAVPTA